jgi:hypothetical protein
MLTVTKLITQDARVRAYTANDNHSRLVERRQRQVEIWAKDLAQKIDRRRFEQAWGKIGQTQV